jgi:Ca2+-transporting ATPase
MSDWHTKSVAEAHSSLSTGEAGLSDAEAQRRLEKFGHNELAVQVGTSPVKIFLSQFKDMMVIILIFATVISAALGEYIDSVVIMIIVILNSVFGFAQEYKAEKALLALKEMSAPEARVIRNGKETTVPARELVPGDIVLLHTGDMVPADCRLVETFNLKLNESTLTGESHAVKKDADKVLNAEAFLGDRSNVVYSSTVIEYGRGKAVVTGTGMKTEIGHIADMIRKEQFEPTPLQRKLHKLGKQIGAAILIICAVVFFVSILRFMMDPVPGVTLSDEILEMFLVAVSLAVAAIPEGLPAVVTISLALGLQRMARRHALIRRLPAVETLGSTTVICSDKTGTLTMGVMNIKLIHTLDNVYEITGEGYEPTGKFTIGGKPVHTSEDAHLELLLKVGALCNDSHLVKQEEQWTVRGDSTEGAFVVAVRKGGLDQEHLRKQFPRVAENPFDSERKRMSTVHKDSEGNCLVYVKGAMDCVLPCCTHIMTSRGIKPLDESAKAKIEQFNDEMAAEAYRVLALAYKDSDCMIDETEAESNLVFLGLAGMIDAPRADAIEAIKECKRAGIRVVMITGDHKLTAISIARQMGIAKEDSIALTGVELEEMTDRQLYNIVEKVAVYARVSPEHKLMIINAWKRRGHIVAMTGDGVNDAPALKRADIGVAMGITGTDVSKEAAEMVLTDDDFASIVHAVEEGRGIYDNIRKFVRYMLSTNSGEVLVIFIAALLGLPLPLIAIQILWINLITDGLPALSLGVEPPEEGIMNRRPRKPKESIFAGGMVYHIIWVGVLMTIGTLGIFAWGLGDDPDANIDRARTLAFLTIAFFQLWHVLTIHIEKDTAISRKFFANPYLLGAVAVSAFLQLAVVYIPALSDVFRTSPPPLFELFLCVTVASSVFFAVELEKLYRRRKDLKPTSAA